MRAVVQRVAEAAVSVEGKRVGAIGAGLLVLLGVGKGDEAEDVAYMVDKIVHLRIFEDDEGKMNRSLLDTGGAALIVSQFTLHGDARKGRRPSFSEAAGGLLAEGFYEAVCEMVAAKGVTVQRGRFGAEMKVSLVNDGPVTILLDSHREF